ncbi:2-amino-4-hydroxy-6-hydroxymethyldihydropteridinepyrophosphokinase [hydrothermal vent metagenome]|uniref:2-amino-4-hydroxy-6-hydroxymethyldihydropteridine diphosphokinase n=1 Tax=hydrothermal vent metagenome TaxID=652676 RepID=A0A1W1BS63_9ZZZZ
MKKVINSEYSIFKTEYYPYRLNNQPIKFKNRAVLGIGGNIGDVMRRFNRLHHFIKKSTKITLTESSPILKNPPFGYMPQPDYYNAILIISTNLTPRELLYYLLRLEKKFGRKRDIINGPRTLDIDIIFYNDISISSKELTIPHQHWAERESVLIPLSLIKNKKIR